MAGLEIKVAEERRDHVDNIKKEANANHNPKAVKNSGPHK